MTAPGSPHRAWVEVDHAALRHNLRVLRGLAPGAEVIGVVKANAYGHGDTAIAGTLVAEGVHRLAVATVDEAVALRSAGIGAAIVVLWAVGPDEAPLVAQHELEPIVTDERDAGWVAAAGASAGRRIGVHLKVDTGLGRQGVDPGNAVALAGRIAGDPYLALVGTMSHLAVAGEDEAYTDVQLVRLARVVDAMRSSGIDPGLVHVSGSGGILAGHVTHADAVRPGIALYGLLPSWARDRDPGLRPVLRLKARPLRLFDLPVGEPVGYGLRFRARRPTRIATLGIGYGDGWPRSHANNGWVLVRGRRAPIVGAVSMDGITVDIGDVPGVTYDDEFVLIGEQEGARITADEVAEERRTINYEVTTALRARLPRLHLGAD
jgi:alanine racemase